MLEMPSLASYGYISSLIRAHYTGSAIVTVPPRLHMKFASRYPLTPPDSSIGSGMVTTQVDP